MNRDDDEATAGVESAVFAGLMVATKTVHGDPKAFIEELRRHGYEIVSKGDHGIVIGQNDQN